MTHATLGERLRSARRSQGLSQAHVAQMLGATQTAYSHWERNDRPVPQELVPALCQALGIDCDEFEALLPTGVPRLPVVHAGRSGYRCPALPPYPIHGSVKQMLALGSVAESLYQAARPRLCAEQVARLELHFPRDTATELLYVYHAINCGFSPARSTLQRLHCPIIVVEGNLSSRLAHHYVRDLLLYTRGELTMALVPQVWIPSVVQSEWYRVDFLAMVRKQDGTERWAHVEIDGSGHEEAADRKRARGIMLPRLGYWNHQVQTYRFSDRLVQDLLGLMKNPEPTLMAKR